jgi:hypothetical protein
MQLRHSACPLSNRHSKGVLRLVANQLSGPEVLLRAARPKRPYPAGAYASGRGRSL